MASVFLCRSTRTAARAHLLNRACSVQVVLLARRADLLRQLKDQIVSEIPAAVVHTVTCDLGDLAAVQSVPAGLPEEFAEVDILVNNAGFAHGVAKVRCPATEPPCSLFVCLLCVWGFVLFSGAHINTTTRQR